ncbi:MAG: hypothetical protein IJO46_11105 [Thermoguttaceae bacterium]|nr:hypothetical protein [Thermoguttaceae bacterium]
MKISIDQKNAQNVGDAMRRVSEIAAQSGFDEAKLRAIETLSTLKVDFESGVSEDKRESVKTALDLFRGRALAALGTLERSGRTLVAITGDVERTAKINAFVERILNEFNDLSGETVSRLAQSMQDVFPPDSLETPWDVDAKTPEFCAALQRHGVADEDAPGRAERALRVVTAAAKELFWDAKKDDARNEEKALEVMRAVKRCADALVDVPSETVEKAMSIFVKTFDPQEVKRADFDFDGATANLADALRKEGVEARLAFRVAAKVVAMCREAGQAVSGAVEGASE